MAQSTTSAPAAGGIDLNIGKILLEGRAFFALVAIVITFSFLSPVYFSISNFLTMSSHVAIFGLLAIGIMLLLLGIITHQILLCTLMAAKSTIQKTPLP